MDSTDVVEMKNLQPKQRKSRRPTRLGNGTETDGTTKNPLFEEQEFETANDRLARIQRESREQEEQARKERRTKVTKSIHGESLVQTSQVRVTSYSRPSLTK
jgi:hypothetical protein